VIELGGEVTPPMGPLSSETSMAVRASAGAPASVRVPAPSLPPSGSE
jgi:hypothetical protein